ncbi:hypothetical protein BC826DRAFT_701644 [Russula brevipes]|nr:hypothetical protein BC826DRAFT_701644 [Russula brevipes]
MMALDSRAMIEKKNCSSSNPLCARRLDLLQYPKVTPVAEDEIAPSSLSSIYTRPPLGPLPRDNRDSPPGHGMGLLGSSWTVTSSRTTVCAPRASLRPAGRCYSAHSRTARELSHALAEFLIARRAAAVTARSARWRCSPWASRTTSRRRTRWWSRPMM